MDEHEICTKLLQNEFNTSYRK